ncbi:MAG: GNAT family N-acetyltransferase [bacterium]|nr:GNAT family N-acetyltransferase [bacterium]
MEIKLEKVYAQQIKFFIEENGKKIGRASLLLGYNDLHNKPFGLLEDVFVSEEIRGRGLGNALVERVIAEAKRLGCYKLIATSRHSRQEVHKWYKRLGFLEHGIEFRLDL